MYGLMTALSRRWRRCRRHLHRPRGLRRPSAQPGPRQAAHHARRPAAGPSSTACWRCARRPRSRRPDCVVHGTTLVTNTLIERHGAPVGLITTDGFRDVLEIGPELRYDIFDLHARPPAAAGAAPPSPRCRERIDADGARRCAARRGGRRAAARELRARGRRGRRHRLPQRLPQPRARGRAPRPSLRAAYPGIAVCTSAEIAPEIREYERSTTALANAYVQPLTRALPAPARRRAGAARLRVPAAT